MMELIVIINILASFGTIIYIVQNKTKEQKELIREVTKALTAQTLEEYVEAIPEDNEAEEEPAQDELEDVNETDERLLIRQLNKEYEDIKSKT